MTNILFVNLQIVPVGIEFAIKENTLSLPFLVTVQKNPSTLH